MKYFLISSVKFSVQIYSRWVLSKFGLKHSFTFILKRGSPRIETNNSQIKRYIKLVMNYFGYDKIIILRYRQRGIIQPRFYVSVKYDWFWLKMNCANIFYFFMKY